MHQRISPLSKFKAGVIHAIFISSGSGLFMVSLMADLGRWYIQTALGAGLGILLILTSIVENDPARGFMGAALAAAWFSLALTGISSSSMAKRFAEAALLVVSIGAVVVGYTLTGSSLLMALMLMILILMLLGFILSFVLPKTRRRG